MPDTKPWAIGIVVICTFFTAIGSLLLKKGADRFSPSLEGILNAYPVLIGLFFYFLGFILLTLAFKHGELSVLFPFVSLSFIWVAGLSYFFLAEILSLFEIIGLGSIMVGVILIGSSSQKKRKVMLRG